MKASTATITRAAIIASLYVAAAITFQPISFGPVQLRVAEALVLLPFIWFDAVPGVFIGCMIANIFGGLGLWDVFLGSGATLAAALLTMRSGKTGKRNAIFAAAAWPVLVNGVVVGGYLSVIAKIPWPMSMLYVASGEAVACYALGIPLVRLLIRLSDRAAFNGFKR